MTRLIIDQTVPLKDYTIENWEEILEHGSFRGYNIQRLKRKLEKDPDSIGFDKTTSSLTYTKNGEIKFEIPLHKIRKCKSLGSCSRFIYWIKTTLFCAEKTDVSKLATLIHEKVQQGRDRLAEKAKWREHKAAMNFSTMAEMKEVISPETYDLIDQMTVTDEHKMLLGKVHQAKEFYKNTHYTFIHGQSLSYWVINQLIKELEKLKNPDQDLSLYHFLRLPHQELKTTRQEHIDRSKNNLTYDSLLGDELLSVDGYFFHNYVGFGESANEFVGMNSNVQISNRYPIIEKILKEYSIDNPDLLLEICNLCHDFQTLATIGHIYAISIPKEKFNDYVYTSHRYGVVCSCAEDPDQLKKLNKLQKNIADHDQLKKINKPLKNILDYYQRDCDRVRPIPQYRILTHLLNPEETPITHHTSVAETQKDDFKAQIRDLAKTAWDNRVVA